MHEHRTARRRRDNIIAMTASLVVVILAVVAQVAFFTTGAEDPEAAPTPPASAAPELSTVPSPDLAEDRTWTGELELNGIPLAIELDGELAPQAVAAFVQNNRDGYFIDKTCHRLTNDGFFVLQCGSIDGVGGSDPTFTFGPIENAPSDDVYAAGTIAMARAGNDAASNGRQFFIVYEDTTIPSDAVGGYTVLGRVTSGLDVLRTDVTDAGVIPGNAENDGSPVVPVTITGVTLD